MTPAELENNWLTKFREFMNSDLTLQRCWVGQHLLSGQSALAKFFSCQPAFFLSWNRTRCWVWPHEFSRTQELNCQPDCKWQPLKDFETLQFSGSTLRHSNSLWSEWYSRQCWWMLSWQQAGCRLLAEEPHWSGSWNGCCGGPKM